MKVLVTGAAGFIGFHLTLALLERGDEVIGVDNLNDYYDPQLKQDRLDVIDAHARAYAFTFLKEDIADRDAMAALFVDYSFDVVVNLAAQAGVRYSLENPTAYVDSNLLGFVNILEGCRHSNVGHLVYASSSSVYGMNVKQPFSIDDLIGGVVRVMDRVPGIASIATSRATAPYKVYNIGNNNPVTLDFFIEAIEDSCGRKALKKFLPMQPGDVPTTYADIDELMDEVGFKPETAVRDGISKFVAWYCKSMDIES